MNKGHFFSFEGIDGSGKSTQASLLANSLRNRGLHVVLTKEPGGTALGKELRRLLLEEHPKPLPLAELLLFHADRAQHIEEVITPALTADHIVICDRYIDSTYAYQGGGRGHDTDTISQLNYIAANGVMPYRTYLLDVPLLEGFRRSVRRGDTLTHFDLESHTFHNAVRTCFLSRAAHPDHLRRIRTIDGCGPLEDIATLILHDALAIIGNSPWEE